MAMCSCCLEISIPNVMVSMDTLGGYVVLPSRKLLLFLKCMQRELIFLIGVFGLKRS